MTLEEMMTDIYSIDGEHADGITIKDLAQAIRQWIKSRLPKEKGEKKLTQEQDWADWGYNQALKDVRQAIGEE